MIRKATCFRKIHVIPGVQNGLYEKKLEMQKTEQKTTELTPARF